MPKPVYIALDVEAAGSRLGVHSTLSLGACVITHEGLSFAEYRERGLVYYAEIKPDSPAFNSDAMRVGCSQLQCLEEIRTTDKRYEATSEQFSPPRVLTLMSRVCEDPRSAMRRFHAWIEKVADGREVVGVTDTVFFDSGRIDLCFGKFSDQPSPFGHRGLDLTSLYRGYRLDTRAKLKELAVIDWRSKPHRADEDAIYLAQIGKVLLLDIMG